MYSFLLLIREVLNEKDPCYCVHSYREDNMEMIIMFGYLSLNISCYIVVLRDGSLR